ncbi:hypothetical protein K0M31_015688 [Melipona bicolor]|uniref:Uncharacterized protein n=1 Tax=Melipona bicolor TaxID=60889 RepID=A0AA40KET6_9HYME|nr:hypothetical protein K0M31_015688 [Melipona bicolor]
MPSKTRRIKRGAVGRERVIAKEDGGGEDQPNQETKGRDCGPAEKKRKKKMKKSGEAARRAEGKSFSAN